MNNKKTTRTIVEVKGIDRLTPDNMVADGSCETLHNLMYHDGAWRSSNPLLQIANIDRGERNISIIYSHPATPDNRYIAKDANGNYLEIEIEDGTYNVIRDFQEASGREKVGHFGKMLLFYKGARTVYYLLEEDGYVLIMESSKGSLDISCDYTGANGGLFGDSKRNPAEAEVIRLYKNKLPVSAGLYQFAPAVRISGEDGNASFPTGYLDKWHGEIMLFACLCTDDGTVVERTLPIFLTSGTVQGNVIAWSEEHNSYIERAARISMQTDSDDNVYFFSCYTMGCPTLRIYTYNTANKPLIKSVKIYSTRVLPIFDCRKIHNKIGKNPDKYIGDLTQVFADNSWGDQPFYLAKEIQLADFKGFEWKGGNGEEYEGYTDFHAGDEIKHYDLELSWAEILEGIEAKGLVYEQNVQNVKSFDGYLEYNNRAHIFGVKTTLDGGELDGFPGDELRVKFSSNSADVSGEIAYRAYLPGNTDHHLRNYYKGGVRGYTNLIAYPDAMAGSIAGMGAFTKHHAANFSLYIKRIAEAEGSIDVEGVIVLDGADNIKTTSAIVDYQYEKYEAFSSSAAVMYGYEEREISDSNRLQVSEPNSPFNYSFLNSYQIGSKENVIHAMNSVAMEISDSKTGEFPLFAFTEEGVFALHLSSEVLYNPITALNFDKVISPKTIAVNGAVAYFTKEGLHLLGANNKIISKPLNNSRGIPPFSGDESLFYDRDDDMLHILDSDGLAYMFSMSNNCWSSMDVAGPMDSTILIDSDTLAVERAAEISLLSTQRRDPVHKKAYIAKLETRPLKFGSAEYKRIETLIARLSANPLNIPITISVYGSNNLLDWFLLRKADAVTNIDIRIRHVGASARYIRIRLEATIREEDQLVLIGFVAELFQRFKNKVR